MKLWGGRFKKETDALVDEYCASITFDHVLAEFDIQGSLAYVKMLGKCQLLEKKSVDTINDGLHQLLTDLKQGKLTFSLADEDIHMNIEKMLFKLIGDDAGKLHIGRSRNDQVALDLHLYLRFHLLSIITQLCQLNQVIVELAEAHIDVVMPGYTHLQRAEPIRFSHHMLAYFNMFYRDTQRLMNNFENTNISPLGAGALAGSGVAIDREYVANLLNFNSIYDNSLDAVSDRDFIVEFLSNASLLMMHFSKLSEEIILWCSQEFSFIELDDQYCTGSSMMPQKKNPDVAELARGKVGRVYGSLIGLLTVLKGLPLAYNKDLQEDKQGLFDAVTTLSNTLAVYPPMLKSMTINKDNMLNAATSDFSNATQLANYLTQKGLAFRKAHELSGQIVSFCLDNNKRLSDLTVKEFKQFNQMIDDDVYQSLQYENVVELRAVKGGTAKQSVIEQIAQAKAKLEAISIWLDGKVTLVDVDL